MPAQATMSAEQSGLLDSPKRFLRFLQETARHHHQLIAERIAAAGFEVRAVVRRSNHAHVWALRLRRGSVTPGQEIQTVKRAVSAALASLGFECPPKEVEALVKGERVDAYFIYAPGTPGTLSFYQGKERWTPEPIAPCPEPVE